MRNFYRLCCVAAMGLAFAAAIFGAAAASAWAEDAAPTYRQAHEMQTSQEIRGMAFVPGGKILVTVGRPLSALFSPGEDKRLPGGDGSILLWNSETGEVLRRLESGRSASKLFAISLDGASLLVPPIGGSDAGMMSQLLGRASKLSALEITSPVFRIVDMEQDRERVVAGPYGRSVDAAAFSPSGDVVVALFHEVEGERIAVFDSKTGRMVRAFAQDQAIEAAMAISPDGEHLAVGKRPGLVQIWDYRKGELRREFKAHSGPVRAFLFDQDGRTLLTGGDNFFQTFNSELGEFVPLFDADLVRVWETFTGKKTRSFEFHQFGGNKTCRSGSPSCGRCVYVFSLARIDAESVLLVCGFDTYRLNMTDLSYRGIDIGSRTGAVASTRDGAILAKNVINKQGYATGISIWERR